MVKIKVTKKQRKILKKEKPSIAEKITYDRSDKTYYLLVSKKNSKKITNKLKEIFEEYESEPEEEEYVVIDDFTGDDDLEEIIETSDDASKDTTVLGIDRTYAGGGLGLLAGIFFAAQVITPLINIAVYRDIDYETFRDYCYVATTLSTIAGGISGAAIGWYSKVRGKLKNKFDRS